MGRIGRVRRSATIDSMPSPADRPLIAPLLYVWGDDDLLAERVIDRFAAALAAGTGEPLERLLVRGEQTNAGSITADIAERLATPMMFGGGTLAIVSRPGALVRRNETRDRLVAAIGAMAPGNAIVFVEETRTGARGPGPRKLVEAVAAHGGTVTQAGAPRPTALGAWIETEARARGLSLAPGAARELADRLGARVTDGDVDRRFLSRIALGELDKLALRHALDGRPVAPDDVRDLVGVTTPPSLWALTDAVGERRVGDALGALDRLLDATPEPVLLAVLHRRVIELLELGDRVASGVALPTAARAMGINSEFRAKTLAAQARRWGGDELRVALEGLVVLDAMTKGVPGFSGDAAQRRLAFTLWVRDVTRPVGRTS